MHLVAERKASPNDSCLGKACSSCRIVPSLGLLVFIFAMGASLGTSSSARLFCYPTRRAACHAATLPSQNRGNALATLELPCGEEVVVLQGRGGRGPTIQDLSFLTVL